MGSYKLTLDAELDLIRIYRYGFQQFGEVRADQYLDEMYEHFDHLVENSMLYQAVDEIRPGYRRSICGSDSIYYRTEKDTVIIVRIFGRQDAERWL